MIATPHSSFGQTLVPGAIQAPLLLVVDDTPEDRLMAAAVVENSLGWRIVFAEDGITALEVIDKEKPDLVLTDLQMPRSNGLRLVAAVRRKFPTVPVVLMTAHGSEEIALEALQAGAASYVPKRNLETDLASTLERVLSASREQQRRHAVLGQLDRVDLQFVLENDRTLIPHLVSHIQPFLHRICDQTGQTRIGVALEEALLNAMLHGNLELSSELRKDGEEPFYRLADERRRQSPYQDRKVFFNVQLTSDEAAFLVRDQGQGFNPGALPDPTDPENLEKCSGRGLLLIRTFMNRVEFNEQGNQISMVKHRERIEE